MWFAALRASTLTVLSACAACAQAVSFLPPVSAYTVQGVRAITCYIARSCFVAADFNADGKIDVAFAGEVNGAPLAGVLLGNGDGTFRPTEVLQPGAYPSLTKAIFTGDFNADGKPDLFVSLDSAAVLYPGNGDGTFGAPITTDGCVLAALADFNGDGKTDLVCGLRVYLSNGNGTFTTGASIDAASGDVVVAVADFNTDHKPDVLLNLEGDQSTIPTSQYAVALGKGDGTFGTAMPLSQMFYSAVVGDFNGDGIPDLAGTGMDGALLTGEVLVTFFGNGDGTFRAGKQTNIGAQDFVGYPPGPTSVGDFNRDGKLDIVAGNAIFAGIGDGTFRFPVFILPAFVGCTLTCGENTSFNVDLNEDGLPDLVTMATSISSPNVNNLVISSLLNDSPGDGFYSTGVSAATETYPVAGESIVSAYGVNLAPRTESASTQPPPTTLGGIRLHISAQGTDSLAPLIYVSPT